MRKHWVIGVAAILGLAAIGAAALSVQQSRQAEQTRKKAAAADIALEFVANEVALPLLTTLPTSVEFSGPLVAPGTAVVRSKATGTLLALTVAEGSRVGRATLGKVDLTDLNSRVAERSAALESARAQLARPNASTRPTSAWPTSSSSRAMRSKPAPPRWKRRARSSPRRRPSSAPAG